MNKKWWIPILVIVFFGVESQFGNYFPVKFYSDYWIFIPRFLFIYFIFISVYYDKKLALIYAIVIGLIMDIVYTEIVGIYLFWYPVTIYLISKLMRNWHSNLFIVCIVSLFAITFIEFGIYGINYILQIATISVPYFVYHRLIPTLILNLVFYLIFCYPIKKYFAKMRKIKDEEEGMFQS